MADEKGNLAAVPNPEPAPMTDGKADKMSGIPDTSHRNLSLILDIPLRVAVELGRTKMLVNDLLNLGQGSVIELSKLAGEPMEVLVNDKLVARGEAVVVNEKFGVRLTDIISPSERVEQLK
jgi:flagellar motor switch protein FliN/FliY